MKYNFFMIDFSLLNLREFNEDDFIYISIQKIIKKDNFFLLH